MKKKLNNKILLLKLVILLASCTANKYLPEGKKFYNGSEIEYKGSGVDGQVKRALEDLFFPEPNTKLFGSRPFVWFYYVAGEPKKEKGLKYWLKHKLGNEPVFLNDVDIAQTGKLLSEKMHNEGYFEHDVNSAVIRKKNSATVKYIITAGDPFEFRKNFFPRPKDSLSAGLYDLQKESEIKEGDRFQLEKLSSERNRLERGLRNKGFYFMDDSYLIFDADTSNGNRSVDVTLRKKDIFPKKAGDKYEIRNIYIIHSLTDSIRPDADTVLVDSIYYYDPAGEFRPKAIIDKVNLHSGNLYTQDDRDYTINKLINLPIFRYVNLSFDETDKPNTLDAKIHLISNKKKSLRVELQGALSSDDYLGPFLKTSFQNRNLFGGAEVLEISLTGGFESQIYGQQSGANTSFELGLNSSILFPKFIAPFHIDFENAQYVPRTEVKAGIKRLSRVDYFTLSSVEAGFGYHWNETIMKKHELFPIDIMVVNLTSTTPAFRRLLEDNSFLRASYEEQFILGSHYSFFYNTQAVKNRGTANDFFFNANLDLSGNLAYLLQSTFQENKEIDYEILGSAYSQYTKIEFDFRFYHDLIGGNKIAARLITGIGLPYGNSESLPYVKQFAIGGSSSIRAFRARSVGPGSYDNPEDTTSLLIDQTGDLKLELNAEYRFDILGPIKGALFADAGNIWTLNEDPERPGSQFKFDNFLNHLAVGAGFGVRYDADFFVIRLDLAYPLRFPSNPPNERWKQEEGWKFSNIVYNIGIGYPF